MLSAIPAGLHVTVIFFCGAVILFSSVATGFFFFNAFGRPYETLQGPMGLYLWTSISGEKYNTMTSHSFTYTVLISLHKYYYSTSINILITCWLVFIWRHHQVNI